MSYSLSTLWYERQRYIPGVLAVAFSALLIALQCGLLFGLFSITSMPVDKSDADIWIGGPGVLSVDLGRPIREGYLARMAAQPEIERAEVYLQGFAYWARQDGGTELCMVMGMKLDGDALGPVRSLTPEQRARISEPGTIIIDESDKDRLKAFEVGDIAEVNGARVRVVGFTKGVKSLAGPYVFCSVNTARPLLRLLPTQVTYILGKCKPGTSPDAVVARLNKQYGGENGTIKAFTGPGFSRQSQWHWITKTKAGFALSYAAALGLLVGAVVTSQTLYAATAASIREFAVLRALGIPRWRMQMLVMNQALWIGALGICLAIPAVYGMAGFAERFAVPIRLDWLLQVLAIGVTLLMALASGLLALRSLRGVEPATLLR